ncbi:hypothetical protein SteCoe_7392 [Stentor coeruleus]|uniref:C2H2-type domain-containing protein n=1 Tax=Stentor coeruleus TaxID=5963 RepID=A0A1R2CMP3_9CILI|nr:hypothetical protein SteCoe_7392 [Stentor coeruleus]
MKDLIISSDFSSPQLTNDSLHCSINESKKGTKRFKCRHCSKALSSKQNLKEHEFTHTGELPYICKNPGCGMRFRQGSVLSAHKRIHTIIEKYANQERYTWIKLTELLEKVQKPTFKLEQEKFEKIDLPPISKSQAFLIPRYPSSSEFSNCYGL